MKKSKLIFNILLFCAVITFGFFLCLGQFDTLPSQKEINRSWLTASEEHVQQQQFIIKIAKAAQVEYRNNRAVLPSIVIAQSILESDWGKSDLATSANNLFGIKGQYHGQSASFTTDEYENGERISIQDYFRKYPSLRASIADHNQVIVQHFAPEKTTDYHTYTLALQTKGYATDPHYSDKLNAIIESYKLNQYDRI